MSLVHVVQLFLNPRSAWEAIHRHDYSVVGLLVGHTLLFALIPAVSGFYGTSQVGWQIGAGELVKMTTESAARIAFLYYLAMLFAVLTVGWMIHWMGKTYGADQPLSQCIALASFTVISRVKLSPECIETSFWVPSAITQPFLRRP